VRACFSGNDDHPMIIFSITNGAGFVSPLPYLPRFVAEHPHGYTPRPNGRGFTRAPEGFERIFGPRSAMP
jgi:hypothetical protein